MKECGVLVQLEIRRRRSLISAQGSSLREPWEHHIKKPSPGRVRRLANSFQGLIILLLAYPGFSFLEPWAEISERLRRTLWVTLFAN